MKLLGTAAGLERSPLRDARDVESALHNDHPIEVHDDHVGMGARSEVSPEATMSGKSGLVAHPRQRSCVRARTRHCGTADLDARPQERSG